MLERLASRVMGREGASDFAGDLKSARDMASRLLEPQEVRHCAGCDQGNFAMCPGVVGEP